MSTPRDYIGWTPINFHYNTLVIFLMVLITTLAFFKYVSVDAVFLVLCFRAFSCLIPLFSNSKSLAYNIGYYLTNINVPLLYILYKRVKGWSKKGFSLIVLFGIGLTIETYISFIACDYSWFESYFKNFIGAPIGESNTVCCFLVPIICIVDQDIIKLSKKAKVIVILFLLSGVIVIKSRTALLVLIVYYLAKRIIKAIKKRRANGTLFMKKRYIFLLLLVILIVVLTVMYYWERIETVLRMFVLGNYDLLGGESLFNRISSNRGLVADAVIGNLGKSLLLGNGMDYTVTGDVLAHNLFIDLLFQSGIIGFGLYIAALVLVFYKLHCAHSPSSRKAVYILMVILLQSMFEPGLLMFPLDFIFWAVVAYGVQNYNAEPVRGMIDDKVYKA